MSEEYTEEQQQAALAVEAKHANGGFCNVRCRETKWLCDDWNDAYPAIRWIQANRVLTPRRLAP